MPKLSVKQVEQKLIKFALTYPQAVLEHPWGHDAVKVKGKMFATFPQNARRCLGSGALAVEAPAEAAACRFPQLGPDPR